MMRCVVAITVGAAALGAVAGGTLDSADCSGGGGEEGS